MTRFTRRQVLASAGVGGLGLAGTALSGTAAARTHYTYAQTTDDEARVKVAWYQTYNGQLMQHQGGTGFVDEGTALDSDTDPAYVPEVSGPVLTLDNVLPGDEGRLAIGIELEEPPAGSGRFAIDLLAENFAVLNPAQPEHERTGEPGELVDALDAALWRDGPISPCDGAKSWFDPPIGDGSMRDVLDVLSEDGVRVCTGCFGSVPQHYCFSLAWSLPVETSNAVQADGVGFDLTVRVHDDTEVAG